MDGQNPSPRPSPLPKGRGGFLYGRRTQDGTRSSFVLGYFLSSLWDFQLEPPYVGCYARMRACGRLGRRILKPGLAAGWASARWGPKVGFPPHALPLAGGSGGSRYFPKAEI